MSSNISRFVLSMLLLSFGVAGSAGAQETRALDTRAIVEYLADDELEGRLTGSPGIRMAADYIIEQLEAIGAEPLPGIGDFRQAFSYTAGVSDTGTALRIEAIDEARIRRPDGEEANVLTASSGATPVANLQPLPRDPPPDPHAPGSTGADAAVPAVPPAQDDPDAASIRALSFSDTGRAQGQLVFAGYGLSVPGNR